MHIESDNGIAALDPSRKYTLKSHYPSMISIQPLMKVGKAAYAA